MSSKFTGEWARNEEKDHGKWWTGCVIREYHEYQAKEETPVFEMLPSVEEDETGGEIRIVDPY